MLTYTVRRLVLSIPTLLFISLVIFLLLELAPGDPMAQVPLTVPPEVKEKMRLALGLGEPVHVRFAKWLWQFFVVEPMVLIDWLFGTALTEGQQRVLSWQFRSPVMDVIVQRMPQTLWVVAMSYVVGILIALPVGIYSAYRQYSVFDQAGTFVTMVGYSVPPFFSGVLVIVIFSVQLGWLPSIYDTTLKVVDWATFKQQLAQMVMPVMVLALQTTAQISRFMRASMLDNLNQDYVRTARAKGMTERRVVLRHALKNAGIPIITVIGLTFALLVSGAVVTERVFNLPGMGNLVVNAVLRRDYPVIQGTLIVVAGLYVLVNLLTDLLYLVVDKRVKY